MSEIYVLSLVTRSAAFLGFLLAALVLFRARRLDGPIVNAFAWAWIASTLAMAWYIVASLMHWSRCCPAALPWMWEWAWLVWAPCVGAAWHLVRVLRRALPWGGR